MKCWEFFFCDVLLEEGSHGLSQPKGRHIMTMEAWEEMSQSESFKNC